MPRFAANLSMMFTERPFLDRFEAAADAGFDAVEFLFPYDFEPVEIKSRLDGHGLMLALFNLPPGDWDAGERGLAALPGREDDFKHAVETGLTYAQALGVTRLHAMAGLIPHSKTFGDVRDMYCGNIAKAGAAAASCGVDLLLEPINTRDVPGYAINFQRQALDVIRDVGAENVKLQFDLYHRQIMEGDMAKAIETYGPIAGHMQIANPPDRTEPDRGELNYADLFERIDRSGFQGYVGCEYRPSTPITEDSLGWFAPWRVR